MKALFAIIDEHIAEADKQSRAEFADNRTEAVRQWRAVVSAMKSLRADLDDALRAPVMGISLREWIEGMSVSVDVSTSEDDAGHRYFGTVTEVMDAPDDKHGVTLLVQDARPNFTASAPAAPAQAAPPAVSVSDEMVSRFLSWPLPMDFKPDAGISFDGRKPDYLGYPRLWPVGTNLLTALQAKEMLEHVLGISPKGCAEGEING